MIYQVVARVLCNGPTAPQPWLTGGGTWLGVIMPRAKKKKKGYEQKNKTKSESGSGP